MRIAKLSTLLINQIAAGEVIERPASVVKELVENSLDAGARRIDIAIEEGGRQLIRISDDGCGIPEDQLALALAPHATSKLTHPDQLAAIGTMGFRGEALASVASISRLRLTSRANEPGHVAQAGATIESSGDQMGQPMPAACAPGTVIEVRDLFFNTPARRKFLRSASAEFGHISEVVLRIAMARQDVSFTLTHNGRTSLEVQATTSRRDRCVDLLGKEMRDALLEFDQVESRPGVDEEGNPRVPAQVWGLAGLPAAARATGKFQYLYINGRAIRDRNLQHAIKEAYRGLIPPDKFPLAVVMIDIDPAWVDVNVHPAKAEVRFRDAGRLHGLVLGALRQRLLGADLTPSAASFAPASSRFTPSPAPLPAMGLARQFAPAPTSASPAAGGASSPAGGASSHAGFVDFFRQRASGTQSGFDYQQVRQQMGQPAPTMPEDAPEVERPAWTDAAPAPADAAAAPSSSSDDSAMHDAWAQAHANAGRPAPPPPVLRSMGVLQVHQSYLVTQDDQGLLIIDQHALHERVMFEELKTRITQNNLESQRLLMPAVVNVTPAQMALLEGMTPLLERIGIEAAPIGPAAIGIQAFPSLLFDRGVEPVEFFTDLLDRVQEGSIDAANATAVEASLHEVLDMMACKAAVKAGDRLTSEELAALLARREEIERSSSCPHGRPTTIRLSLRDLEKHFKRS